MGKDFLRQAGALRLLVHLVRRHAAPYMELRRQQQEAEQQQQQRDGRGSSGAQPQQHQADHAHPASLASRVGPRSRLSRASLAGRAVDVSGVRPEAHEDCSLHNGWGEDGGPGGERLGTAGDEDDPLVVRLGLGQASPGAGHQLAAPTVTPPACHLMMHDDDDDA